MITRALATAFLAGELQEAGLVERGGQLLGRRARWLRRLAQRITVAFEHQPRPSRAGLLRFLLRDAGLARAVTRGQIELKNRLAARPAMLPVEAASDWRLPAIATTGELAEWLNLTPGELQWFADLKRRQRKPSPGKLKHYHYRTLAKPGGAVRLIEAPKSRLKAIQRRLLNEILCNIPPHEAAHGFRPGRSIKTFAEAHVGRRVVLRLDLQDFFPSIAAAQVEAMFRTAGYADSVARLLTGLCTNVTPEDTWWALDAEEMTSEARRRVIEARWRYAQPHLPQGAPTSPALANLAAYRLDCRLTGLARSAGAIYTRYADDLSFSGDGDFEHVVKRFRLHVAATALEEGFTVNHHKTRIMRRSVRQRLAGLVVNERLNISRGDYDLLLIPAR